MNWTFTALCALATWCVINYWMALRLSKSVDLIFKEISSTQRRLIRLENEQPCERELPDQFDDSFIPRED